MSREGPRLRTDFRGRGRRAADFPQDHRLFAGQGKKLTTPFGPAMTIRHLAESLRTDHRSTSTIEIQSHRSLGVFPLTRNSRSMIRRDGTLYDVIYYADVRILSRRSSSL